MTIAVLSDTHLPVRLQALPGVVYEACAGTDLIIHAGDIEDRSVVRDLERLAPVKAVHGNMDGMDTRNAYPGTLLLNLQGFKVGVTHGGGSPWGIRKRIAGMFATEKPDLIIHGHTHEFFWKKEEGIWFLNPGAVANSPGRRSMAILTLKKGEKPTVDRISF